MSEEEGDDSSTGHSSATTEDSGSSTSRRELLAYAGGAGLGLGIFRAIDNTLVGYGVVSGTNLVEQPLREWALEGFEPESIGMSAGNATVRIEGDTATIVEGDSSETVTLSTLDPDRAAELDDRYGLEDGPITELAADLPAIADGDVRFEASKIGPFFERLSGANVRPYTTGAFRGSMDTDPAFVESFTGVHPSDPEPLVRGLADAFREHSYYDVPRYAAGSVEDNVLMGRVDVRKHFESPVDFEALAAGENDGLFCSELTRRAIDAFHAAHPIDQSPPVCAAYVRDSRHKHAYNALATVVRSDGDLLVPMTFVDYTYALLYDDLRARRFLGEGIEGYDSRHRATEIVWNA